MMIKWGIFGTGNMATKFAESIDSLNDCIVVGVASKSKSRARKFTKRFKNTIPFDSYEELAMDVNIDVIYISTLNNSHFDLMKLCLIHSKPVLCEKPFTISVKESKDILNRFKIKKIFAMEAMWSRFFPLYDFIKKLIESQELGVCRLAQVNFGSNVFPVPDRLKKRNLGGGILLDRGIYCLSILHMLFGSSKSIQSMAYKGKSGVEEQISIILGFENGLMATVVSSFRATTNKELTLFFENGNVRIKEPFYSPTEVEISKNEKTETYSFPLKNGFKSGLEYEIIEVNRCILNRINESKIMPFSDTIEVMKIAEKVRNSWQLL